MGRGREEERVAIGRRIANKCASDRSVGASPVLYDYRDASLFLELLRKQTREYVDPAAGREWHHEANDAVWIIRGFHP